MLRFDFLSIFKHFFVLIFYFNFFYSIKVKKDVIQYRQRKSGESALAAFCKAAFLAFDYGALF